MKVSDLKSVIGQIVDLAESGDLRGASYGAKASGALIQLIAHSVAKANEAKDEPKASQPKASQPKASQPKASQPKASQPKATSVAT